MNCARFYFKYKIEVRFCEESLQAFWDSILYRSLYDSCYRIMTILNIENIRNTIYETVS